MIVMLHSVATLVADNVVDEVSNYKLNYDVDGD